MIKIYLAGPIFNTSYDEATGWRATVTKALKPEITCFSPLRFKDYLRGETKLAQSYEDYPMSTAKGLTARDHYDVLNCDLLFVNCLTATVASIGTCLEIAWANAYKKPIVLIAEQDNIHRMHAMVSQIVDFTADTLEEGIIIARAILLN